MRLLHLLKGTRKVVIQSWRSQTLEPVIEGRGGDWNGVLACWYPDKVGSFCKSATLFYMDLPPDRI